MTGAFVARATAVKNTMVRINRIDLLFVIVTILSFSFKNDYCTIIIDAETNKKLQDFSQIA